MGAFDTQTHKKDCNLGRSYFFIFIVPWEQEALEVRHAPQGHTAPPGKHQNQMSRRIGELQPGDFIAVFEGRNGRGKVSKWNRLRIG